MPVPDDKPTAYIVHMRVGPVERLQLRRVADYWQTGRLICTNNRQRMRHRLRRAAEKHGYDVEDMIREEDWHGSECR